MVELSKRTAAKEGVSDKASFVEGDMFEADFSQATVLALFLLPDNMMKLQAKFLGLKPGARIVGNTFGFQDWNPDEQETITTDCSIVVHGPALDRAGQSGRHVAKPAGRAHAEAAVSDAERYPDRRRPQRIRSPADVCAGIKSASRWLAPSIPAA